VTAASPPSRDPREPTLARFALWCCIGCGSIENRQPCLGRCDESKLVIVRAVEHDEVLARAAHARVEVEALTASVRALASMEPQDDPERAYRALQADARLILRSLEATGLDHLGGGSAVDRLTVWSCAACGRIEAPQPCIGVCVWPQEEVVRADHHDEVEAQAEVARRHARELSKLVHRLASVTPRDGHWTATGRAMQDEARGLMERLPRSARDVG
jgi:hypothetical protein